MGVHLSYSEIDEHPITEEEAGKVYRILEEHSESVRWPVGYWLTQVEERWAKGEDLRSLAREVVKVAYYEHEKRLLFGSHPTWRELREAQLDLYAAVGIEPPEGPERTIGHGS